jgi:hypothetical protein
MCNERIPTVDESARDHESARQKVKSEDVNKYFLTSKENLQLNSFCVRIYYKLQL